MTTPPGRDLAGSLRGADSSGAPHPALGDWRERPRLISTLDRVLDVGVVLVAAGPGYGKTRLLSSWADHRAAGVAVVWARPSEPGLVPDVATAAEELARQTQGGGRRGVIVVDDPILTWPSPTIDHVADFATAGPRHVCVIVASRDGRSKPWAALEAEGRLQVIGTRELCFQDDEAAEILAVWSGLDVLPDVGAKVNRQAEGWALGLRMAADELGRHHGDPRIIPAWSLNSQALAMFVGDELAASMTADDLAFVELTAELPRLDPHLCDLVSGRTESSKRLERLVLGNLFTERIPDAGGQFRYHPLIASEMARRRRARDLQGALRTLGEASDWYRAQGLPDLAVEAALRADDGGRVARLLRAVSGAKLRGGEAALLVSWMERMPQADLWRDPALSLALARACGLAGDSLTPRAVLRATQDDGASGTLSEGMRIARAHLESSIRGWEGRLASMADPLADVPTRLGPLASDPTLEMCAIDDTAMSNSRIRALLMTGQVEQAVHATESMLTPGEIQQPSRYTVVAVGLRALALAWAGHVPEAREAVRQGRRVLARFHGPGQDPLWLHVASGWVADPQDALQSLAQIEEYAAGSGLPYRRALAALTAVAVHVRLGNSSEATRALALADREVHSLPEPAYLEALLDGFRVDTQPAAEHTESLNPQEVVMLRLLAQGATRSRIARETSYSINTVKTYLRSAYRKLGAVDREQAIGAAVALGIVDAATVAHREDES